MSDVAPEAPPAVDYLEPFETFGAYRLRHGIMYRGRIRPEFAEKPAELDRILDAAPGEHHIEDIDGRLYASIRVYRAGKEPRRRLWLHVGLLLLTIITTLGAGAEMMRDEHRGLSIIPFTFAWNSASRLLKGQGGEIVRELWPKFRDDMASGIPYAAALLFILLAHEMGHYVAARRYGIDATLPFLIPAPHFFGTFGALIRMRSPIVHRRALFDVGIAGPVAGLVASFAVCIIGLRLSAYVPVSAVRPGEIDLGNSVVFDTLTRFVLGPLGPGQKLLRHPMAVAGWCGFFITFLNLLPLGQLDGGHMWYALIGSKQWYVGVAAFGFLIGMGLIFQGWLVLAVLVVLVLRIRHPAVMDESVELDWRRKLLGAAIIVMFLLLFIPEPITVR